jgi:hypothetical protein
MLKDEQEERYDELKRLFTGQAGVAIGLTEIV